MSEDMLIEDAIRNTKIRNALLALGKRTLGDVAQMHADEFFLEMGLGRVTYLYTKEALACHGLVFRQETLEEILKKGPRYYEGWKRG